jgi:hypothetical protein
MKKIESKDSCNNNKEDNAAPKPQPPPHPTTKQHEVYMKIYDLKDKAQLKMYTDQTGKFPQKSSCGNQYIMVVTGLDSNAILVGGMKNRTAGEIICAYQVLVDRLTSAGIQPKMHLLDNKCSVDFKKRIKFNKMMYQCVPPHDHRWKIAETTIKIFKAHFVSILCGSDKSFPLCLWYRLLPQAEHMLNMLRPAGMTPSVSAYAYLWGQHDYNANPFALLGCKVNAHITPGV